MPKYAFKKAKIKSGKQETMRQHKEPQMNEGDGGAARHERLDLNWMVKKSGERRVGRGGKLH